MFEGAFTLFILSGIFGTLFTIGECFISRAERRQWEQRSKTRARIKRYRAINDLRIRATYHDHLMRRKGIAAASYLQKSA